MGIEPALSAWEFAESVRFMQPEHQIMSALSVRERPLIPASNGPLMARHRVLAGAARPFPCSCA